ncbi:MAG: TerD family protein, partial [Lachnospiraceae bacterium]|nr:TerD family protein [Lachnospiraceae bacterium]
MFNIPMNTKGALSFDTLTSINNGAVGVQQPQGVPTQNTQPMAPVMPVQNTQPMASAIPVQNTQPMGSAVPEQQAHQATASVPVQNTQPMVPRQRPQGNGVHLKKGQKTSLSQMNPTLSEIQVCLGWDILNQACDLDASAFMLGDNDKVVGDDWFVFYGQPISPDGSIQHSGDSTDGAAIGDDEIINIKLNQLNPLVKKIVFIVTINEAYEKHLNFSMVSNAYVRVIDKSSGNELVNFKLSEYFSNVTSM